MSFCVLGKITMYLSIFGKYLHHGGYACIHTTDENRKAFSVNIIITHLCHYLPRPYIINYIFCVCI